MAAVQMSSAFAAKPWPKEPTTFIGVALGAPYQANFPKCDIYRPMKSTCVYSEIAGHYSLLGAISLDFGYSLTMDTVDGRVKSFFLTTDHSNYEDLLALLIERYGPPTITSSTKVKNSGGGVFQNRNSAWRGKKVTIEVTERAGRVDRSAMMIYNNGMQATYRNGQQEKLSKAAGQL